MGEVSLLYKMLGSIGLLVSLLVLAGCIILLVKSKKKIVLFMVIGQGVIFFSSSASQFLPNLLYNSGIDNLQAFYITNYAINIISSISFGVGLLIYAIKSNHSS